MLAQPRHATELQRVRGLVQRNPAQELVVVGLQLRRDVAEVGRDEQQPRGRVGVEHGELVLAEHAAGQEAGDRTRLDREQPAGGGADDSAERAVEPAADLVDDRLEHATHRGEVGVDPLVAAHGLGSGDR